MKVIFSLTATSQLKSSSTVNPESFFKHRNQLQGWKQNLLRYVFTNYPDNLATTIQQRSPIILTTDGTKSSNKSGGGWIVSSDKGKILAHGANLDFVSQSNMHSHRLEAHIVLSILLFLI